MRIQPVDPLPLLIEQNSRLRRRQHVPLTVELVSYEENLGMLAAFTDTNPPSGRLPQSRLGRRSLPLGSPIEVQNTQLHAKPLIADSSRF